MPDSAAHGLRRHPGSSLLFRKLPRELTVGHGLPVGNLQQQRPHRLLKRRASRVQRRQKARLLPRKVKVQPAPGLGKDRRFPFGMLGGQSGGKIFRAVEPQPGQPDLVRRQQDTAQRGVIMLNICHRICTSPAEKQAVAARSLFIIIPHSAAKLYPYFAKYPRWLPFRPSKNCTLDLLRV